MASNLIQSNSNSNSSDGRLEGSSNNNGAGFLIEPQEDTRWKDQAQIQYQDRHSRPLKSAHATTTTATAATAAILGLRPWENALCGATAGVVSRFVIAPLDVIKIRLQLDVSHGWKLGSPHSMFRSGAELVRAEGIRALWKGNLSAEYLYLIYSAVQFTAVDAMDKLQAQYISDTVPPSVQSFISGAVAGSVGSLATYPFDLLRTRFAAQHRHNAAYSGLMDACRQIWTHEGISGFYRGAMTAVVQILPYMGCVFATQRFFKQRLQQAFNTDESAAGKQSQSVIAYTDAVAGGMAGLVSKTLVFPLDTVRKRLQVQGPSRKLYADAAVPRYSRSAWTTARQIIRHESVLGLFKGLVPGLIKSGPTAAATFFVYGTMKDLILSNRANIDEGA
ncbi:mitochondrial carrier [Ramicandelaber brevisporus]|nr:mitochondrial carrier [Ramicandelaber brevisporus]